MNVSSSHPQNNSTTFAQKPRVFIADHSPAVITRLIAAIRDVAQIAGHANNARDTLTGIHDLHPDLALLDVAVDNGFELLRQIKRHHPPVTVAVLTHSSDDTTRRYCLRSGAAYFLDKLREFDRVRDIVIALGVGHTIIGVLQPTVH